MNNHIKNMLIGLFVLAALAIIVFIVLFLHPTVGDQAQVLHVRFADIDKVNVGTRVTFSGRPVGEVTEIREIEKGRQGPSNEYGSLYMYELTLKIDSGVKVYQTDVISLRTAGLLGERSIAITPVAPPRNQQPSLLSKNQILYASESGSVENTMQEVKEVAGKAGRALDTLQALLSEFQNEGIIEKISEISQNFKEISAALNQPDELIAIVKNLHTLSSEIAERVPNSWDILDESLNSFNLASGNFNLASKNFNHTTETLDRMMTNTSLGQGTIGKALVSDDLYIRLVALLNKGEVIMDDINHYGLLYNMDKGWQRLRARRMNLLERLNTPQEFRNYFNDEVNQISTSLSRVSMVLDKTSCQYPCLLDNCEFIKVFSDLLRRVEAMQESLKLYNQQLVDCDVLKLN